MIKCSDSKLINLNKKLTDLLTIGGLGAGPGIKSLMSSYKTIRAMGDDFYNHGLITTRTVKGDVNIPLETLIKRDYDDLLVYQKRSRELYSSYLGKTRSGPVSTSVSSYFAGKEGKLTFEQFQQEAGKAAFKGDIHGIPQVAAAAQEARKVFNKGYERLRELGYTSEDLKIKDTSYMSRVYDVQKIVQDMAGGRQLLDKLTKWLMKENEGMSFAKAEKEAIDIIDNITGLGEDAAGESNRLLKDLLEPDKEIFDKRPKSRVLDAPSDLFEGYLKTDLDLVLARYIRNIAPVYQLKKWGDVTGYKSLREIKDNIKKEFKSKLEDTEKKEYKDPEHKKKAIHRLHKEREEAYRMAEDNLKAITGSFYPKDPRLDRFLGNLRKFQTLRLLGGVLLSSIPDLMMPVFKHGFIRSLFDGYFSRLASPELVKLAKSDLQELGVAVELQSNDMLRALTTPGEYLSENRGKVHGIMDAASGAFSMGTGMAYWNNFGKNTAGLISMSRTVKTYLKGAREKDISRLRQIRIHKGFDERIKIQLERHAMSEGNFYIPNLDKWDDLEAKKVFQAATRLDVENTILTPGVADIPLWVQKSGVAKTIFQFKSFITTANSKILLSGLQRREAEVISGILGLIALGSLSYIIKSSLAGKEVNLDFDNLIKEGISRSGVAGMMGDIYFGLNPFRDVNSSRFAGVNATSFIFGPTHGLISDLGTFLGDIGDLEWDEKTTSKFVKLLPLNNLFYLRVALEKLND